MTNHYRLQALFSGIFSGFGPEGGKPRLDTIIELDLLKQEYPDPGKVLRLRYDAGRDVFVPRTTQDLVLMRSLWTANHIAHEYLPDFTRHVEQLGCLIEMDESIVLFLAKDQCTEDQLEQIIVTLAKWTESLCSNT